jgi:hypothetical protein
VSLDDGQNVDFLRIQVGSYVQWESLAVAQFDKPKQVKQLSDDGKFVFVEGTNTGFPIDQIFETLPPLRKANSAAGLALSANRQSPHYLRLGKLAATGPANYHGCVQLEQAIHKGPSWNFCPTYWCGERIRNRF